MPEKETVYTWLSIRPDARLYDVRGTYIEFAKKIDNKVVEKEFVFVPGLDIHAEDINAAFDFPFKPRESGVILKFKSESGNTWWIELNRQAYYRELNKAKVLEKSGYFKEAAIIYESLGGIFKLVEKVRQTNRLVHQQLKKYASKRWSKYWMY